MDNLNVSYTTQYYNTILEWERNNLNIDTASESQVQHLQELQEKAVEQSGLSLNELTLIIQCRKYRILKKINVYALKQINTF